MRFSLMIPLVIGVGFVVLACQKGTPADTEVEATPGAALQKGARAEHRTDAKLVRKAELRLEVDSYAATRRAIDGILKQVDGYLAHSQVTHNDHSTSTAKLELRVPNEKLESTMRRCSELGSVLSENVSSRDVTEEYFDISARSKNAKKLERRLLELASSETKNVKDVLEVERELGRVREEIEVLDGKLKLFDDQVASSRLTVELTTRDKFASGEPSSFSGQVSRTFSASIGAMLTLGRGLLLVATALAPWLPLLLLGAYLLYRLVRPSERRAHG